MPRHSVGEANSCGLLARGRQGNGMECIHLTAAGESPLLAQRKS